MCVFEVMMRSSEIVHVLQYSLGIQYLYPAFIAIANSWPPLLGEPIPHVSGAYTRNLR